VETEAAREAKGEAANALKAANDNIISLQGELVELAKATSKDAKK